MAAERFRRPGGCIPFDPGDRAIAITAFHPRRLVPVSKSAQKEQRVGRSHVPDTFFYGGTSRRAPLTVIDDVPSLIFRYLFDDVSMLFQISSGEGEEKLRLRLGWHVFDMLALAKFAGGNARWSADLPAATAHLDVQQ